LHVVGIRKTNAIVPKSNGIVSKSLEIYQWYERIKVEGQNIPSFEKSSSKQSARLKLPSNPAQPLLYLVRE